jgi:hypothetical protein
VELIKNLAISKMHSHGILLAKFLMAAVFVMPHRLKPEPTDAMNL